MGYCVLRVHVGVQGPYVHMRIYCAPPLPPTQQEAVEPISYINITAFEMAKRIGMNITKNLPAPYCSLHVARGPWLKKIEGLDAATQPSAIATSIAKKCPPGSNLYISTNEQDVHFFEPLRVQYNVTLFRWVWSWRGGMGVTDGKSI